MRKLLFLLLLSCGSDVPCPREVVTSDAPEVRTLEYEHFQVLITDTGLGTYYARFRGGIDCDGSQGMSSQQVLKCLAERARAAADEIDPPSEEGSCP
jgi:hypothetical protein